MDRKVIRANRIRRIQGSFGWIEHRFIREGHFLQLGSEEILLYFFFAMTADVNGVSFWGTERILSLLKLREEEYYRALSTLEHRDYIARQGSKIQLLSLPVLHQLKCKPPVVEKRSGKVFSLGEILQAAKGGDHE